MTGERSDNGGGWTRLVGDVRAGPGPTLICIGGVHGNEPAGLFAAGAVLARLAEADGWRGRVVTLAGHVAALNAGDPTLRCFDRDLNRMFEVATLEAAERRPPAERSPEQRELSELTGLVRALVGESGGCATLLDMHTVSSPSPAFAYIEDSLPARALGLGLGLPLVLGLEEELPGLLADFATSELGVTSLLVEAGTHDDPASVGVHEAAIWVTLELLGMVDDARALAGFDPRARLRAAAGRQAGRVYDIRRREEVGDPPLEMADRAQAFRRVWKGLTPIGTRAGRLVRAPADGLLFMPNRQHHKRPGDDGFFVLRRVWRRLMWCSAWFRSKPLAHRVLARLPGVREDPSEPGVLHVDHRVAAVMTRDLLHLLGYRVRVGAPIRYHRLPTRLLMSLWVIPRAVFGAMGMGVGRPVDTWTVRRRELDVTPPCASPPPGESARRPA